MKLRYFTDDTSVKKLHYATNDMGYLILPDKIVSSLINKQIKMKEKYFSTLLHIPRNKTHRLKTLRVFRGAGVRTIEDWHST